MRRLALVLLVLIFSFLSFYSYKKYINPPRPVPSTDTSIKNVYLITASGLRADHLSSYMYQPIQTPAIDFLAYDGIRFTNAFTSSTESLTAHLSLLTGTYPFREPVRQSIDHLMDFSDAGIPENLLTLPDILTKNGYRTAAFLADPELRYPAFFADLFHHAFTGDQNLYPWQSAYSTPVVCKLAREWIKQNQTIPHFLLLNFHEPTFPFEPPPPYNRQYTKHPYDGEIAGLDEQIGLFVDLLKETGLFKKSVIILTAPYGETLSGSSRYTTPNNNILNVPLLIAAPGLLPRKEIYDAQVSLIDVLPTVLELTGLRSESQMDGLPLFQKGKKEQIKRDFVLGTVPFSRFMGLSQEYFMRNGEFLYVNGPVENAVPHRASRVSEESKAEWIQEGRSTLKNEGLRMGARLPDNLETDPALLLEKVVELARQHHPEFGLDLLQLFAAQMSRTSYLETLIGMLASASKDQETALEALRKAVELSPTIRTLPFLARVALAANRPEEALNALRQYKALNPRMPYDVRSTYAITLQELNRNEEALLELATVLRQNPRYAEAYFYRGQIWKKLNRLKEAETDFKMAIEAKSDYIAAYRELAQLFEKQEQPVNAIPYLRQLLRFEPENYEAMLQLALLHQKAGNFTEAKKLSQAVIVYAKEKELKGRAKKLLASL